ncbi:hypothetical protein [Fluviicola sp.]|jgi:hypothetical protein|uniref:hypothetical protein n=1 Tax=Fluviicola sp. TaxID=1917219 RepID=UPI00263549D1|nr:hypothetical protein [Fluviicola sp.]
MEKPDWVNDDKLRTWNNGWTIGYYALLFLTFPSGFILGFNRNPSNYVLLIIGIVIFYSVYELILLSYTRVTYLNGNLEFKRPLLKFSLLFRNKNNKMRIRPDEWTEVYRYWHKGGTAYYFRNNDSDAYFVSAEGLTIFYSDLGALFSHGVKITNAFPRDAKRRMRKVQGRVM